MKNGLNFWKTDPLFMEMLKLQLDYKDRIKT